MIVPPAGASSCCSQPPRSSPGPMTMIRPWSKIGWSDQDLQKIIMISSSKIRSQAPPSPGQLCPYCHHNAMVILTGRRLEVTFPVLVLGQERRHVLRPPSPTGNCLIWLKQATTGANAVHIYTAIHTCIYIIRCIYIHSTHTHKDTHSLRHAYTQRHEDTNTHKLAQASIGATAVQLKIYIVGCPRKTLFSKK